MSSLESARVFTARESHATDGTPQRRLPGGILGKRRHLTLGAVQQARDAQRVTAGVGIGFPRSKSPVRIRNTSSVLARSCSARSRSRAILRACRVAVIANPITSTASVPAPATSTRLRLTNLPRR